MTVKDNTLLRNRPSSAIVAVSDLARARQFYGETLGLEAASDDAEMLTYRTGDTQLIVYPSEFAGTNKANAVVWDGGEAFDAIADQLRERGVAFEEYPELGMEIAGGVHRAEGFKGVWFKDPDGNVLHVVSM
jgi:catechol 2,3-dioxygenase-like lactoylglutathione lyase family enzyme